MELEDVPFKGPKQFLLYIMFIPSYVEGHVQKNSSLNFMSPAKLGDMKISCKASLEIIFR